MKRFVSSTLRGLLNASSEVELPTEVAHHVFNVMRLKVGDQIKLCDGAGTEASATLISEHKVQIDSFDFQNRKSEVVMFVSLIKQDRWSWMLEKLTEVGVSEIFPVVANRSVPKVKDVDKSLQRWRRICENAARQSDRRYLPEVHPPVTVDEGSQLRFDHLFGVPNVEAAPMPVGLTNPAIWIGPEGGFSADEMEVLVSAGSPWCFSPHTLRAETAAVVAAAFSAIRA